jgi:SAM-dependent methyltransferase
MVRSTFAALFVALFVALLGSFVAGAALAQAPATPATQTPTPEKLPPALDEYKGREIAQTMHWQGAPWLTRDERNREEDTVRMVKELKLKPEQVVCDMGCGNGYYTLQISKRVGPKGLVYAVDIQPEMLSLLKERAAQAGAKNVKPVLGSVIDPYLPAGSCDLVLCVDVYHEFSHPEHMLKAIRKALKPDGRLLLVEFRMEDPKVPIKMEHKMIKEEILKELFTSGFKVVEQFDGLPWQHMMWFARDDAPAQKSEAKQ